MDNSIVIRRFCKFSHASAKIGKPPISVATNASQSRSMKFFHQPVRLARITIANTLSRMYSTGPVECSWS